MRRSEIERRLEEAQATDRRRIAAERRELFSERRSKQHKIALLEEKVELSGEVCGDVICGFDVSE